MVTRGPQRRVRWAQRRQGRAELGRAHVVLPKVEGEGGKLEVVGLGARDGLELHEGEGGALAWKGVSAPNA